MRGPSSKSRWCFSHCASGSLSKTRVLYNILLMGFIAPPQFAIKTCIEPHHDRLSVVSLWSTASIAGTCVTDRHQSTARAGATDVFLGQGPGSGGHQTAGASVVRDRRAPCAIGHSHSGMPSALGDGFSHHPNEAWDVYSDAQHQHSAHCHPQAAVHSDSSPQSPNQ